MENRYHIFKVYKGGELRTSTNLTKDNFISELIENFIDFDEIEFDYENPDFLKLSNDIKFNINELSSYAGGDSQVASFYCTTSEKPLLKSLDLFDNIRDIIKQYCSEYLEYELTENDIKLLNELK